MGDPTGDAMRFETAAVHAGQDPEPVYGAVNVPIYQNATYLQEEVGKPKVWDYARGGNPTRAAFEAALAALEGGERCFAFASGMAAETTLLLTLRPGDHVLLADDVYGGTYRLLSKVLGPWGLKFDTCDLTDPAIRPRRRPGGDPIRLGGDALQPDAQDRRHRGRVLGRGMPAGRRWWSTTRSRRPPRNVRSRSAPTWSCTA